MSPRSAATATGGIHAALASPTRRRLLELLHADSAPRDVHDLGEAVGLHPSTVRFHLEILRRAGLVIRQTYPQAGVGRPRTAYAATGRDSTATAYEDLASQLAANLADTNEGRAVRAEQIGLDWAQQLVPSRAGTRETMDETARRVSGLFDRIGFEPELSTVGESRQIALRACPFRAVARQHPEVVCSMHLGLLRGSLDRLGARAEGRLLPFVQPELCLAQLSSAD